MSLNRVLGRPLVWNLLKVPRTAVFVDATILHWANVVQSAETALTQQREDGGQSVPLKNLCVWDLVLPPYADYASEAAQMETIQSLLLGSASCPSFTGVEECA